jgi:hypothetical protein
MIAHCLASLLISALLTSLTFGAEVGATDVEPDGETTVSIVRSKFPVDVRIKTRRIQEVTSGSHDASLLTKDCFEGRGPCSLIEDISIVVNKVALFVPRSAFRGLSNVRVAKLTVGSKDFRLVLRGGDASEGYFATIAFDKTRVISRRIASSLTPHEVLEETIYRQQKETFDR